MKNTKKTPAKKNPAKQSYCKELDCSQKAEVQGFCRLHFLRLVKSKKSGTPLRREEEDRVKKPHDRRHGNRLIGLESAGADDEAAPTEVERYGNLDLDFSTVIQVEELDGLPAAGETETPLKKTGT